MGTLTESFGNLTDYLLAEHKKNNSRSADIALLQTKGLMPFLPTGIRCSAGTITDIKDRQAGPLDLIVSIDGFPPFSHGGASTFLADGVIFCLAVKDWAEHDLTEFGNLALQIKSLDRKKKSSIPCLAISFDPLPLTELNQFLNSKGGQAVDGILCIGHHVILRNSSGLYGNAERVPFVTERPGPEALKSFLFHLMQLSQSALNIPFGLADYQHL